MAIKVTIRWTTRDEAAIESIRNYFKLPKYTTLNGWTPGMIEDNDIPMFEETARRGFFTYRETDWHYNGTSYSW